MGSSHVLLVACALAFWQHALASHIGTSPLPPLLLLLSSALGMRVCDHYTCCPILPPLVSCAVSVTALTRFARRVIMIESFTLM